MHEAVKSMLEKYDCQSERDYINALKEIFQEIALLGLWRSKFYEKAAFYGGSALRILHGLDRFSEDLDFTLLEPMKNFDLAPYNRAIVEELASFGFQVSVDTKIKNIQTHIESAFIKGGIQKAAHRNRSAFANFESRAFYAYDKDQNGSRYKPTSGI